MVLQSSSKAEFVTVRPVLLLLSRVADWPATARVPIMMLCSDILKAMFDSLFPTNAEKVCMHS